MSRNREYLNNLIANLTQADAGRIGSLIGFGFSLSLVLFGLVKTIFILLVTLLGHYLGVRYFSRREDFRKLLDKIFPPGKFR